MRGALAFLLLFFSSMEAVASPSVAENFGNYLVREKVSYQKSVVTGATLKKDTMAILGSVSLRIEKMPSDVMLVEDWMLAFELPKRQEASGLWVALCEEQYGRMRLELRKSYESNQRRVPDSRKEALFVAFSLSQAVLASEFGKRFSEQYQKHYPSLELQKF